MACIKTEDSILTMHRLTIEYVAVPLGSVTDNNLSQPEINLVSEMYSFHRLGTRI
jgi:hypothetical protein